MSLIYQSKFVLFMFSLEIHKWKKQKQIGFPVCDKTFLTPAQTCKYSCYESDKDGNNHENDKDWITAAKIWGPKYNKNTTVPSKRDGEPWSSASPLGV